MTALRYRGSFSSEAMPQQTPRLSGYAWRPWVTVLLCSLLVFSEGCRSHSKGAHPSVTLVHVAARGAGAEVLDHITGRVTGAPAGSEIVLYARTKNVWWVQPFRSHKFTDIAADGTWDNVTHLGEEYAALLVAPTNKPNPKLTELPPIGGEVLAIARSEASPEPRPVAKIIHFSGYDWRVRSSPNDRGGEICEYEPSDAWVDDAGYLHLLMGQTNGRWHCAAISLTRSLGYGTYRFVVADSMHFPTSSVFSMNTQDGEGGEMAIELSRWGKSEGHNADFVVQPYYVPGNTAYFQVPAGPMTYVMRWSPGSAVFKTFRGASTEPRALQMEHVFKSGIPIPSQEMLHLALYGYRPSQSGMQHPVEVVVQKFEYLP